MRLALVLNPRAKAARLVRIAGPLRERLGSAGAFHAPESLDALERACAAIREAGAEVVAIAGGDGTLHTTLTQLHRTYGAEPLPAIALLRGGTMNTIADAVRVPRSSPSRLLGRLLVAERLVSTPRPTMACEGRLGFLFGVGVVPAFLQAYYATGRPSPATAARVLGRAIADAAMSGPFVRELTAQSELALDFDEGESLPPTRALAVAAGTIPDIGLGFRPFHRALETTSAIHCLRIDLDARSFLRELPRLYRAQPMRPGASVERLTRGFTLHAASAPLLYMLDGDLYRHPAPSLHVGMGPVVRFVTPRA